MLSRIIASALVWLGLSIGAFAQAPQPVPALPDSARLTSYSISTSTCACSVGFQIYGSGTDVDEWIQVYVNGVAKLSTDPVAGWSLSSVTGSLGSIPRPITNAVLTFNAAQTATVVIVGDERPRRLSQFPENRGVAARDLNQAITDAVAVQRELWDKSNRSIVGQPGEVVLPLPSAASRANLTFVFDANGNPSVSSSAVPGSLVTTPNNWSGLQNFNGGISQSLNITASLPAYKFTGTTTGSGAPYLSPFLIFNTDQGSSTDTTGAGINSLSVLHNVVSGAGEGNRNALLVQFSHNTNLTGTNGALKFYDAIFGQTYVNYPAGGTGGTARGDFYGVNAIIQLQCLNAGSGQCATNINGATGSEIDISVQSGASTKIKQVLSLANVNSDAVKGSSFDAALGFVSDTTVSVGFTYLMAIGRFDSKWPMDSASTVLGAVTPGSGSMVAGYGVDFNNITFTNSSFRANNFSVAQNGTSGFGFNGTTTSIIEAAGGNTGEAIRLSLAPDRTFFHSFVDAYNGGAASGNYLEFRISSGSSSQVNLMRLIGSANVAVNGAATIGSLTPAVTTAGELAFTKISASGSAPGAGYAKMEWVAGTSGGTCKLIAYAGTSSTPTTIIDNIGAGC